MILTENIVDDSETEKIARKVTKTRRDERFDIEGEEIVVSASVGIAIGGSGNTANELLRSAGTYGFEALVRWESPERGRISPNRFVPLAEEAGWLLRTSACNPSSSVAAA